MLRTALLQLNSGPDITQNLETLDVLVRDAAGQGAGFILTPENTDFMAATPAEKMQTALPEENHPVLERARALAQELKIWILLGSIAAKIAPEKIANRSLLLNPKGQIAARYDKIHLFDVDLPTGESHRESAIVQPGNRAVTTATPFGIVGLSVCYDLRFAHLYRALAQAGANILTVPAAFTVPTGQAHWEILLRARAIETGSFLLAPAQCGTHEGGRETYGHSLAIGPWGDILADGGTGVGITLADLDLAKVEKTRIAIPALTHDRVFEKNT